MQKVTEKYSKIFIFRVWVSFLDFFCNFPIQKPFQSSPSIDIETTSHYFLANITIQNLFKTGDQYGLIRRI